MHKHNTTMDQVIRITLIGMLTYWSFYLIHPFIDVLAWGFILAVALFPLYKWLNTKLDGSSTFSAMLVTLLCLIVVVGSVMLMTNNMFSTISNLVAKIRTNEQIIPQPPDVVKTWPIVGEQLHQTWLQMSDNIGTLINQYANYLLDAGKYLLGKTAKISFDVLLFIISVFFSGYLLRHSKGLIKSLNRLAEHISPERGRSIILIINNTIQSVSRGVIGLSIFQALAMGLILLVAGLPAAGLISFIALVMCIAQLGLFLLVVPIVIWLFFVKSLVVAIVLSILLVIDALLDNFLKPFILARGLTTPVLVIFLGVIGGVLAHGVIGIFIGPIILAIFYDLVNHWLATDN